MMHTFINFNMKFLICLFLLIMIGCSQETNQDKINAAVVHFADVFITKNVITEPQYRIKGKTSVKNIGDSIFYVSGLVEGFASFNMPVNELNFSETLRYSGDNLNEQNNWECKEIYIGNKKMK